jgi:hypothetical protein
LHLASKFGRLISVIQVIFFRDAFSSCIIGGSYICGTLRAGGGNDGLSQ